MKELAASPDASLQSPLVLSGLGGVVLFDGHREEALALLQHAQRRYPDDFWLNYLLGLYWENENPQAAVGYFRAAMAIRPESDETCAKLGRCLLETKEVDGAIAAFQNALALNPSGSAAKELARALASQGRLEEARSAWEKVLEQDPPDHNAWYGYAQLCLFLGNEEAYQAARRGLLARFGEPTSDWILAERVRLGQFSEAIPLLENSAAQLPNRAGPRLVLAMAEHRSGAERDARESFASAVSAYNWRASHADHATAWVSHALRREAERLIVPDSESLLRRESLASENCDRLALFSLCEFEGIHLRASLLAVDAFAADADLADQSTKGCLARAALESDRGNRGEVLDSDLRYRSACCAALVAEGRDNDSAALSRAERTQWGMRAVNWLTADLVVLSDAVENGQAVDADLVKQKLILWREEPAFAGIRDARCLQLLSADERKACIKLWDDVQGILARCGDAE
jgi:eukaryotic-like serine/threonine-protein kinase